MTALLLLGLKLAVALVIFAIGLEATPADATFLLRRPGLLARSMLAMYVVVPFAAVLITRLIDLTDAVEAALLVLAVSAGAPLLPKKLLRLGDPAYAFSLVVLSSLLAIVVVPMWLATLGGRLAPGIELSPVKVAGVLAKSLFVPLVAGMLVRALIGARAERAGALLMRAAGAVLTLAALALLALHWDVLQSTSLRGLLAAVLFTSAALAAGHVLGGPDTGNRGVLAIACATRHVGIALAVASALSGPRTAVLVASYLVTSAAVSIPYLRWARARERCAVPG